MSEKVAEKNALEKEITGLTDKDQLAKKTAARDALTKEIISVVTLPSASYEKVGVLKPFAICVTASGLAYAIPQYEYPREAPGAAIRHFAAP